MSSRQALSLVLRILAIPQVVGGIERLLPAYSGMLAPGGHTYFPVAMVAPYGLIVAFGIMLLFAADRLAGWLIREDAQIDLLALLREPAPLLRGVARVLGLYVFAVHIPFAITSSAMVGATSQRGLAPPPPFLYVWALLQHLPGLLVVFVLVLLGVYLSYGAPGLVPSLPREQTAPPPPAMPTD